MCQQEEISFVSGSTRVLLPMTLMGHPVLRCCTDCTPPPATGVLAENVKNLLSHENKGNTIAVIRIALD